ncbi:MAG: hypothetical protein C0392_09330 [Syntrophus sp. (in: bacteria)]|nr:hypothetical protein [Syntrophus sp. (in: bacteria)]
MKSGQGLSIVIITRDTKELLRDLLKSIEKDASFLPFLAEIIVIDNGSTDGTHGMIHDDFPSVLLVRNEKNMGFAASANEGIRSSTGDYIFLLNSDTLLIGGEALKILHYMMENKDVGICGPQLVYPDMRLQRSFAGTPSLLSEIVPFRRSRSFQLNTLHGVSNTAADVASLIGAAIMMRKEALSRVSGFDEQFFFFLEETDLCIRVKKAGFRVVLFQEAKVVHFQGKTVGKNWVRGRMEYNISMGKFIKKHYSSFHSTCFQAIRFMKALVFLVVCTLLPLLLVKKRTRRSYLYYFSLARWYLSGCPDNAGLRTYS